MATWIKKEYRTGEGVGVEYTLGSWSIFKLKKEKNWRLFNDAEYAMFRALDKVNLTTCKKFAEGDTAFLNRYIFKSN